ncbi:hypothetical protein A2U01_0009225, partial [Trifolium medium]|nr:hypothetical protein [Trifolium medium]
ATKCRLFVLTLKGPAMTWFKGLEDDSIDSWRELCRAFSSHFTARKRQPKTMVSLSNIIQGKEESLRDYIERFTREAIEIKGAHDKLKCYIFEKGLWNDTKKDEKTREERGRRTPRGRYHEYTPLNTSREKILQECLNTEFVDAEIRPPKELRENSRTEKGKFCKYHKSAGHETEDCIQLKEAIEDLIKQGKLNEYTVERSRGNYDKRKHDSSRKYTRKSESPKRKRSPRREPSSKRRTEAVDNKEDCDNEGERDSGKRPFVAAILGRATRSQKEGERGQKHKGVRRKYSP